MGPGGPLGFQSEYSRDNFNITGGMQKGGGMLGGIGLGVGGGPKSTTSASMHFANLDDAKTISQADCVQERNMMLGDIGVPNLGGGNQGPIGENNETKMTENEAFLAYCRQDNDSDDD